jgi:RNA polymerase sigma-70 factor, ECF subfamily
VSSGAGAKCGLAQGSTLEKQVSDKPLLPHAPFAHIGMGRHRVLPGVETARNAGMIESLGKWPTRAIQTIATKIRWGRFAPPNSNCFTCSETMQPTSMTLLDRLKEQRGHEDWTRFIEIYEPFIRRFIRMDATLAADEDDVCQEVMRKIVSYLPRFQRAREGSFRTWLKTITINEVSGYWRQKMRQRNVGAGTTNLIIESLMDPTNPLSEEWDREHGQHILRRLQELVEPEFSPTTWRAFQLRVLEERPSDEVAAALQITRNAVDIAKSRVLARLRRESAGFLD